MLLKCSHFQSWRHRQHNSMQKPHSARKWKIVVSKWYYRRDFKQRFDAT